MKASRIKYLLTALSVLIICSVFILLPKIKNIYYLMLPDKTEDIQELLEENIYSNSKNNIILITIDTLRADHLSCYGYEKKITPNIDRLAANGVLFYNTITPIPVTGPSHSSIFTALYPYKHGVRENGTFYLDNKYKTLAEILKDNDYMTAAFPSAYVLHSKFNITRGFDYRDEEFLKPSGKKPKRKWQGHDIYNFERTADDVTLSFLNWLTKTKNEKFFAWIHYFDPHGPYNPPGRYRKKGQNTKSDFYDGEIAYTDECIGYILKYISGLEKNNNTMIILSADHGESLGEHNYWYHAHKLYDPSLRVPLIFYQPTKLPKGKIIKDQVGIIDIMPTILDTKKIEYPPDIDGKSLLDLIRGAAPKTDNITFSETLYPYLRNKTGIKLFSVRTGEWKIIKSIFSHEKKVTIELYQLVDDPGENNDLAIVDPQNETVC